jgi:hypothetical protein
VFSAAEGGNFGSGFLAAGFGSLVPSGGPFSYGNLIESAALGGAGSVLGGGKFANGAVTGAFSYAAGASYANDNDPANTNSPYANTGATTSGTIGASSDNVSDPITYGPQGALENCSNCYQEAGNPPNLTDQQRTQNLAAAAAGAPYVIGGVAAVGATVVTAGSAGVLIDALPGLSRALYVAGELYRAIVAPTIEFFEGKTPLPELEPEEYTMPKPPPPGAPPKD